MSYETCNGWSNYETWACNLHLSNDQNLCNYVLGLVADAELEAEGGERDAENILRDSLHELVEGIYCAVFDRVLNTGVALEGHERAWGLLVQDVGSMHRVDFREIAASWLEG